MATLYLVQQGATLRKDHGRFLVQQRDTAPTMQALEVPIRKEPHLAFDLMEKWRSPIVDTLVIVRANQQVIKPDAFTSGANGGVYLTDTTHYPARGRKRSSGC